MLTTPISTANYTLTLSWAYHVGADWDGAALVAVVAHTDIHYLDGDRGMCKWDVDQTYILYCNTLTVLSQSEEIQTAVGRLIR